jgi:hypothetical protein
MSCKPPAWYRWYIRAVRTVALGGGLIMLLVAIVIHDSSSVPLLILGPGWLLVGLISVYQLRQQPREIVLDGACVEFRLPESRITIPAAEILEVSWPWWDPNRMGYLRFRTRSHGTIRTAPRLDGLGELLTALRAHNPALKTGTPY